MNTEPCDVPTWLSEEPYASFVEVFRTSADFGPATKLAGCLQWAEKERIPLNSLLAITDDDYLRGTNWLETLTKPLQETDVDQKIVQSYELSSAPNGGHTLRVRGCVGFAASVRTFGTASDFEHVLQTVSDKCFRVDDVAIAGYMRGLRGADIKHVIVGGTKEFKRIKGRHWHPNKTKPGLHEDGRRIYDDDACNAAMM